MTHTAASARYLLGLAIGLALTGCISHDETIYRDEPRAKVEFENDAAARHFYEALSRAPSDRGKAESTTEVHIPIVFEHKQRVVRGENIAFNEAVRRCDTNGDGRITELEARIFAEHR